MNHKATIVSLTNLSHSAPTPPLLLSLKPFSFFFSALLPLPSVPFQKEKTRAVRKAC